MYALPAIGGRRSPARLSLLSYCLLLLTILMAPAVFAQSPPIAITSPTGSTNLAGPSVPITAVSGSGLSSITPNSQLSITASHFYRRRTGFPDGQSITITNVSSQPVTGSILLAISNLTPNVTLANSNGTYSGTAYLLLNVPSLAPNASLSVNATFFNPKQAIISYTPVFYTATSVATTFSKVEVFAHTLPYTSGYSIKIGTVAVSPYNIVWNNVAPGGYYLTAQATDSNGITYISNFVPVNVIDTSTVRIDAGSSTNYSDTRGNT